jgi:hypothetical protein
MCALHRPLQDARAVIGEQRVDPGSLAGRHRARSDKAERLASVMEGREARLLLDPLICEGFFFGYRPLQLSRAAPARSPRHLERPET